MAVCSEVFKYSCVWVGAFTYSKYLVADVLKCICEHFRKCKLSFSFHFVGSLLTSGPSTQAFHFLAKRYINLPIHKGNESLLLFLSTATENNELTVSASPAANTPRVLKSMKRNEMGKDSHKEGNKFCSSRKYD